MHIAAVPDAFDGKKYLSLETFRANGAGVRTPVWFAAATDRQGTDVSTLYAYSTASSGKAKRLRRSNIAKVAPCDMRGKITGPWFDAHAAIVTGDDFDRGMQLLDRKFWPWKQILGWLARVFGSADHGQRVVIAIRFD
jgi:PPOX class probable F420-dependent enzyme